MRKHIAAPLLVLVALSVLLSLPGGALAAAPEFHVKIADSFPDNICGVPGTSQVAGVQHGSVTASLNVMTEVTQTFTADDGRVAIIHVAYHTIGTYTDNGDGTATFVNTAKGLPEQIRGGGGGVTTRDAGVISFSTTFVIGTGEVLSTSVIEHGPHPDADSGFAVFCAAFLSALG